MTNTALRLYGFMSPPPEPCCVLETWRTQRGSTGIFSYQLACFNGTCAPVVNALKYYYRIRDVDTRAYYSLNQEPKMGYTRQVKYIGD